MIIVYKTPLLCTMLHVTSALEPILNITEYFVFVTHELNP